MTTTKQLMTSGELAAYLGVRFDAPAMWRWRGRGPPFIRIGRSIKYRLEDVEQWLADSKIDPANPSDLRAA